MYLDGVLLTQILHILISQKHERRLLRWSVRLDLCLESLEHDNAVGQDSREEGGAISELCPSGVVVECHVGEAISKYGEQEEEVSDKPTLD